MTKLKIQQNLSLKNAINFCNRLWKLEKDENYEFDFANLKLIEPFTMAYVANELKRFATLHPQACSAINLENHSYAANMGLYKAFGLEHGKEAGKGKGGSTYIPLTILNVLEIQKEAELKEVHVGEALESKSYKIAQTLVHEQEGDLVDTLTFLIREIMLNIVEHSQSETIEYCAQYWPVKHLIEVAILDTGMGIQKSLSTNPCLDIKSEKDAMQLALKPYVSGKRYKGIEERKDFEWQNSGLGLYLATRICKNGGDFLIVSNDSGINLHSEGKSDIQCNYKGTALRLRMDTSKVTQYSHMLMRYSKEGSFIAKEYFGEYEIKPSLASTKLTRDFKSIED